jgi:hypothetical protein
MIFWELTGHAAQANVRGLASMDAYREKLTFE